LEWGDSEEDTIMFDKNEEGSESDETDLEVGIEGEIFPLNLWRT